MLRTSWPVLLQIDRWSLWSIRQIISPHKSAECYLLHTRSCFLRLPRPPEQTPKGVTGPDGQISKSVSSPLRKNISVHFRRKSPVYLPPSRTHKRGVSRSSRTLGAGMRWTRQRQETNDVVRGRRSRVVLTPRRWRQVGDDASHHAGDGGKQARSPGRARRKPLKPSRREMPGVPVNLW
jgi:hypothetical protein